MRKNIPSSGEEQELIRFSFDHTLGLPENNIKEAVILVSIHDGMERVFKEISNLNQVSEYYKKPSFHLLDNNIPIIYPTTAFLNSQHKHNFVSMHYLLNIVKRAKFIFAFKHADLVQRPIQNIRQTMKRFFSLFAKTVQQPAAKLSPSCGYIVCEPNKKAEIYVNMFSGMYEEDYVKEVQIKSLCRHSMKLQNIVLLEKDKKKNKQQFIQLLKKLKYFELPQKVEPGNLTNESYYLQSHIEQKWQVLFKKMYSNIDVLIDECKQEEKNSYFYSNKQSNIQRQQQSLSVFPQKIIDRNYLDKKWPLKIDFSQKTHRLVSFISRYLSIGDSVKQLSQLNYQQNEKVVQQLMKILYDYGYLSRYSIYLFIVSFFKFYQFYPKNIDSTKMLIQKIDFKYIIGSTFNQKMTVFINKLYNFLEEEIPNADIGYPFKEVIRQLTNIYNTLVNKKYQFATIRTFKKLLKYRAQLAFRRATVVTNAYNITKAAISEAWLQFLRYALQSTLIQSSKIQVALLFFAEELIKKKQFQLALKVYSNIPEYKSYKKIIAIYERDYNFNPQILKYRLSYDWPNKRQPFEDYCRFLIRIGYCQKVRELCLEGLTVLEEDEEASQILKGIMISARGEQSRDVHNQFLQNLNEQQKQIKIDQLLLQQLQKKFRENKVPKEN